MTNTFSKKFQTVSLSILMAAGTFAASPAFAARSIINAVAARHSVGAKAVVNAVAARHAAGSRAVPIVNAVAARHVAGAKQAVNAVAARHASEATFASSDASIIDLNQK